jgi:hypothetical protein
MSAGFAGSSGYYKYLSATKTNTSTATGTARLIVHPGIKAVNTTKTKPKSSVVKAAVVKPATTQQKPPSNSGDAANPLRQVIPDQYKWNLPPHNWSLPLRPTEVDAASPINGVTYVANQNSSDFHGLRRGRIWFFDVASNTQNMDASGNLASPSGTSLASGDSAPLYTTDRKWGFQFLWNPESISSQVSRNMTVTPSSADSLRVVSGAFPSQETFSVSIVLDRVNDFACAAGTGLIGGGADGQSINSGAFEAYRSYYNKGGTPPQADVAFPTFSEKLNAVISQGTMGDLEYLFRAINGTLTNSESGASSEWSSLLGKKTANIGYLQPTLMAFQFGPTLDNLAWVGWIDSLSLNHTMFSENMVPLRTEVSISVAAFTGSGVSSK